MESCGGESTQLKAQLAWYSAYEGFTGLLYDRGTVMLLRFPPTTCPPDRQIAAEYGRRLQSGLPAYRSGIYLGICRGSPEAKKRKLLSRNRDFSSRFQASLPLCAIGSR